MTNKTIISDYLAKLGASPNRSLCLLSFCQEIASPSGWLGTTNREKKYFLVSTPSSTADVASLTTWCATAGQRPNAPDWESSASL